MGVEHQDVGRHQHRVHEQASGHPVVGLLAGGGVFVDGGFVGVGAVEQAFAGHTSEQPSQLRNLRDIALAVEKHFVWV